MPRSDDDEKPASQGCVLFGIIVAGVVGLILVVVGLGGLISTLRKGDAEVVKDDPAPAAKERPRPAPEPDDDPPPVPVPDLNLPKLTPPKITSPKVVTPKVTAPPKLTFGIALPDGTAGVRQVAFGGGPDGFVALAGAAGLTADQHLTVAHVKTGALIGRVVVPNGESVNGYAVSPAGRFAAVHVSAPAAGDVVVIHELATAQSSRFTPYPKRGDLATPDLVFAGFVGPDRLLTAHATSGFDVWQLPGMSRVCGHPGRPKDAMPTLGRNGSSMRAKNVALSPDGGTLAIFDGTAYSFHNTATAARVAQTEALVKGPTALFWGAAFSPDGRRFGALVGVVSKGLQNQLRVWDVADGKRLSAADVPPAKTGTAMTFWGPDHVLLSHGGLGVADVMAVESGEFVARVEAKTIGGGKLIAPESPGGALWYVYDRSTGRGEPAVLASVPPPAAIAGRTLELTRDGPRWK